MRPVWLDFSRCFSLRAPDAQGVSGGVSPVTLRVCFALCVQVRCAQDTSGVDQQSVRCGWCRHMHVLAIGGNGRVQMAYENPANLLGATAKNHEQSKGLLSLYIL